MNGSAAGSTPNETAANSVRSHRRLLSSRMGQVPFASCLMREDRKDPLRLGPSAEVTKVEVLGPIEVPKHALPESGASTVFSLQPVATLKGHDHPALAANY